MTFHGGVTFSISFALRGLQYSVVLFLIIHFFIFDKIIYKNGFYFILK